MMQALMRDPIYRQLHASLREAAAALRPGEKFFSEREVCRRFDVCRATANKVLSALVLEGVLRLRRGVGTFVSAEAIDFDLRTLVSFTAKARAAGKKATTKVLRFAATTAGEADAEVRTSLAVEADAPLRYVERLRRIDGAAVILERRHIVMSRCGPLKRSDLAGSLYGLWADRQHLEIAGADEIIRAVNLDGADARLLGVEAGSAALLVTATGHLAGGEALWFERTLYRADAYRFRNRIGRVESARPAMGMLVSSAARPGADEDA